MKRLGPGVKIPAQLRYQACDATLCSGPTTANVEWTVGAPSADSQQAIAHIRFGSGERVQGSGFKVQGSGSPGSSSDAIAKLDQFTVMGTAGGYLPTKDFLSFIHDAENGVKQRGLFEGRGPLMILLIVFIGGLALNLTPCVLPMIPINLAIIGAGTQSGFGEGFPSRRRGFLLGAAYGGAMALVYGVL